MRLLALLLVVPAGAATFETAPVAPIAPVELRVTSPIEAPAALTAAPLPLAAGLEIPNLVAPSPALSAALAVAQAAGPAAQAPKTALGGLTSFAGAVAKDQRKTGGEGAAALSGEFFDAFMPLPEGQAIPTAADASVKIAKEISGPPETLRARGIRATVPVYGSARIPSPEKAQALYKETLEKHGRKPKTREGQEALKAARQGVKMSKYYELARRFGELVARGGRGQIAVVTGGGPGIMEGANRGAFEAGGPSVGYNITLPHEQQPNPYLTPGLSFDFDYFSSRKMNLRHGAIAMVYFPGGFGTMDELFEVMTLMQTGKIPRRPIVLMGEKEYWKKVLDFREFAHMGLISKADLDLFKFAETAEEAWAIVRGQARAPSGGARRPS